MTRRASRRRSFLPPYPFDIMLALAYMKLNDGINASCRVAKTYFSNCIKCKMFTKWLRTRVNSSHTFDTRSTNSNKKKIFFFTYIYSTARGHVCVLKKMGIEREREKLYKNIIFTSNEKAFVNMFYLRAQHMRARTKDEIKFLAKIGTVCTQNIYSFSGSRRLE